MSGVARLPVLAGLVVRRLGRAALVLFATLTVTFFGLHLAPGNPVLTILGGPAADPTPATVAAVVREYALDRPLSVQFALYLNRLLHGDLGSSWSQHVPVLNVLRDQIGATLELLGSSLAVAWLIALASVLATARRGRWLERAASTGETVAAAMPQFWLGIVLLSVFAFRLRLLPPAGSDGVASLVLPTLSLALPLGGFIAQVTREALELALDEPFVLSARARGQGEWGVRLAHALRHALLPGISLSGWAAGALAGGAVVVEIVFSRKGIGRQLVLAIEARDMPLALGITLCIAAICVGANALVDTLHLAVDPRVRRPA